MRNMLILLFLPILQSIAGNSYSQAAKLTIDLQNTSIEEVLSEIEKQSEFYFVYNTKLVDVDRRVDIQVDQKPILDILATLFSDTDVEYMVLDRQILLSTKEHLSSSKMLIQPRNVTGTVKDENGEPIIGASIRLKGTNTGSISNSEGVFTIEVIDATSVLQFSFIGYVSQEITVGDQTSIEISMTVDYLGLEEVIVIGYGTMKKSDLTGSVASIKSDVIEETPHATVTQAMQGRVAGVHVIQNTGQPGPSTQIRIRGTNSILGNNSPFWVIDGFPGDPNILNVADIESIEVLKDASATAIYGSRGANGVILVTTKHGQAGVAKVDFQGSYSMQTVRKRLDLMNAEEYMQLTNIQQLNDVGVEYFSQNDINNAGEGTDWQEEMIVTAPTQDYSLTVSGGSEKTQFSIGGSYYDQTGIMLDDQGYKRFSLRANINHKIGKKLDIAINTLISRIEQGTNFATASPYHNAIVGMSQAPPSLSPYEADGSYTFLKTAYPFSYDGLTNPVMYAKELMYQRYSNNQIANVAFTYRPIDGLSIKVSGNYTNTDYRTDNYMPLTFTGSSGEADVTDLQRVHLNSDNVITYNKTINDDHNLTLLGAFTYEQNTTTTLGASGVGFLSDSYETYNLGAATTFGTPSSSYAQWVLMSYLGRFNYSYKGKYLATASIRADGSSRYSEGNKWGYFPSAALAWRISDESFMENAEFISSLKLRAGYGKTGSTAINPYATLNMLATAKTVFDHDLYTFFAPTSTYPGDLRWETTAQTNFGLDIGFLRNRVSITADYYIKNTEDLLNAVQMPRSSGYSQTIQNVGSVQNKGFELLVDATILNKTVKWDITANISRNRNEVQELYKGQYITGSVFNTIILGDYINLIQEGQPLGVFHGYLEDGYDENGIIKYKDLDGIDGITADDKTIIGDPNPDFLYGISTSLTYEGFELSAFFQGSQGNDIFSLSLATQNQYYGIGINMFKEVLTDHWTPENTDAKYPIISSASTSLKMSDRFVYDGSYFRMKNIQLAYNIPVKRLGWNWLKDGQVYVSGQNLWTVTSYPWWDPEVNSYGGESSVNQGIDLFTYPTLKGVTFGVKLGF